MKGLRFPCMCDNYNINHTYMHLPIFYGWNATLKYKVSIRMVSDSIYDNDRLRNVSKSFDREEKIGVEELERACETRAKRRMIVCMHKQEYWTCVCIIQRKLINSVWV